MSDRVELNLRRKAGVLFPGGSTRYTYWPRPEEVDLDSLTPRARALAEAFAQCFGAQPLEVVMERDATIRDTVRNWEAYYTPDRADERPRKVTRNWSRLRPPEAIGDLPLLDGVPRDAARTTAVEWLEREARTWPLDWYVVGAVGCDPVPSMMAGAADRYLVRETVLDYMREHGHPMGVTAWDTLIGTGHLPDPDRYVCARPQWRPETFDAYIGRDREMWPISRIAEYLGYDGPSATGSARKQLHRWGFAAEGRQPGRAGESLYAADQIQAAHTHRPGRGRWGSK